MGKLKSKFIEEKVFVGLMWIAVAVVLLVVASIIWTIFVKGIGAISWEMVSSAPGKNWNTADDGGFLNAIVGSLLVVAPATLIAMVVSIPVVFYMNLYRRRSNWLSYVARLVYDVLYGIPSIVYGAFAFMIMVMVGMRASLLGGIIVSTLLIIPMFIRSGDEISRSVPDDMIDAAYSLGATKWETLKVVFRQVLPGMATASLLAVGKAIGDAAAVTGDNGPFKHLHSFSGTFFDEVGNANGVTDIEGRYIFLQLLFCKSVECCHFCRLLPEIKSIRAELRRGLFQPRAHMFGRARKHYYIIAFIFWQGFFRILSDIFSRARHNLHIVYNLNYCKFFYDYM